MKPRFVSSNYNKHIIFLIPKVVGDEDGIIFIINTDTINRERRVVIIIILVADANIKRTVVNNKLLHCYIVILLYCYIVVLLPLIIC